MWPGQAAQPPIAQFCKLQRSYLANSIAFRMHEFTPYSSALVARQK